MKKCLPILLILCFGMILCSPAEKDVAGSDMAELVPVQFSELGYTAVLAQAKEENKHVLIDFFSPT